MAVNGVGSGLDVASLVQQLVSAERGPADARLDRTDRRLKAEISALGTLRSAFSSLKSAAATLASRESSLARKATVPEGSGFVATAGTSAALGRYQVEVRTLASAHKLTSAAHASADAAVGTGRLTIVSGGTTIEVDVDPGANSLSSIRDAINAKAAGKGVSATLVRADDGHHLVLTATETGTSNALRITASGGDGGLAALAYDPPAASTMVSRDATDALIRIDGMDRTSASNTITDALAGVTLTLTKAEPGTVRELSIGSDTAAQKNAAKNFVNAFNASVASIATHTAYNTSTGVAAALNGDAMVRGVSRDMRELVSSNVSDLKAAGITINKDGTLKLDEAAFDAAIAKDPQLAARLFGSEPSSLAKRIEAMFDTVLASDGALTARSEGLDRRTRTLTKERADLDLRMKAVETRYRAQFTALDTLMTRLNSSMTFLQQQLGL
ncbi:flagellar filament capping protein FliD [Lysobacter sp. N42]|uniref:flagellar filament capping protein FliD n=1 Tax=Lysobacter sp. N42 TaxID=2545719 RepID=UPI00104A8C9C|nr:flagellar filament capping protein FliD [Lysobacter sp. N42]TCZ81452.1 flagellar protein [Lysobacter sp. N42]